MKKLVASVTLLAMLAVPAWGGLTITQFGDSPFTVGRCKLAVATVVFDSSYPTGGESLTPEMLGLRNIWTVSVDPDTCGIAAGVFLYHFDYDRTNELLVAYCNDLIQTPANVDSLYIAQEAGNTRDLSGISVGITVIGE